MPLIHGPSGRRLPVVVVAVSMRGSVSFCAECYRAEKLVVNNRQYWVSQRCGGQGRRRRRRRPSVSHQRP